MRVAISACLLGFKCRYDGTHKRDDALLDLLEQEGSEIIPFCPEEACFGTPRDPIDLMRLKGGVRAIRASDGVDVTEPIVAYAQNFFDTHPNIDLFIGKDKSPSCGVCSAKVYDQNGIAVEMSGVGVMAQTAIDRSIKSIDAQKFKEKR